MNIKNACDLDIFYSTRRFVDSLYLATDPDMGFSSKSKMNVLRKYGLNMLSELIDGLTQNGYPDPSSKIKKAAVILRAIKWELCESLENRYMPLHSFTAIIQNALETESVLNSVISPGKKNTSHRN